MPKGSSDPKHPADLQVYYHSPLGLSHRTPLVVWVIPRGLSDLIKLLVSFFTGDKTAPLNLV